MFEKTLTDVVKGIRASKRDTSKYISQCIAEIKTELNSSDMFVKANALQKLTFLQMMGFSMNWDRASFATIEVMSSPRFAHKRVGYLAASQGFTQDTEVVLLTTNLLKKELRGAIGGGMHGVYEAGLAINCISNIVTEDLARDLLPELTNLTSHPQPYLRKKAILCLFKLFVKYPQGLRLTFSRLQQCLDDPNSSVVSCAVNVITELSDKNPKNYLHLAPSFFQLLTQSSNNWMLIKVVKLLGSLVPEEPRLARKLLDPLCSIVRSTQAKSLLYESVRTITLCLPYCRKSDGSMPPNIPDIVELCANTLHDFVTQNDQNLKYLGLVGFSILMQSHPHVLSDPKYRPLILACLSDQDVTIRTRALDLLNGMASKKNLADLVPQLLKHVELASGSYKKHLVAKIVEMCSGDKYSRMVDFKWYLDVLFQLGHCRGIEEHGELLMSQVTNVALRVAPVRSYAVRRSIELLMERNNVTDIVASGDHGRGKQLMPQLLPSIAWIIGEYSDQIQNALLIDPDEKNGAVFSFNKASKGTYHAIVQCLSSPSNVQTLPTATQKVYLQAAMKAFTAASMNKIVSGSELEACLVTIFSNFPLYMQSTDAEVVERSFSLIELLRSLDLPPMEANNVSDLEKTSNTKTIVDLLEIESSFENISAEDKVNGNNETRSLEWKIRGASQILVCLLKPTPMKPPPPKSQKKKRESPIGVTVDLLAPADSAILSDLLLEEKSLYDYTKASVSAVSFTQQFPYKQEVAMASTVLPDASINNSIVLSVPKPMMNTSVSSTSKPNKGDPFYLDSVPSGDSNDGNENRRFEAIQLPDSDDDEAPRNKMHKKKKTKKDKTNREVISQWPPVELAIFDSDDENEDRQTQPSTRIKGRSKEFAGLAKVDLTTPLRDDEVMPQRSHRVVPEAVRLEKQVKKSKKDKKKKSKILEVSPAVGDLLDLGGAFEASSGSQALFIANTSTQISHPICSAFDDLLDMTAVAMSQGTSSSFSPPHLLSSFQSTETSVAAQTSQLPLTNMPWMKASVKTAEAIGDVVDWDNVTVLFKANRASEGSKIGGFIVMLLQNKSNDSLSGLTMHLQDYGTVSFDTVPAMSFSSQSKKVGPIFFSSPNASQELKTTLILGRGSVPVKMKLPASLLLNPVRNLTLEQLAQELSTNAWSTASTNIDLVSASDPSAVKSSLMSFLNAAIVVGSEISPDSGTFASCSTTGVPVRFLAKLKEGSAKVDVKSTNRTLSKAIASDLKRLLL